MKKFIMENFFELWILLLMTIVVGAISITFITTSLSKKDNDLLFYKDRLEQATNELNRYKMIAEEYEGLFMNCVENN